MKNTKSNLIAFVLLLTMGSLLFWGCKKDTSLKTANYRAAQDNSTAENTFNRSYNQISKAMRQVGSKSVNDTIVGCPTLYITGAWPNKVVTLDFGTACTGDDGVVRRGKIISTATGLYVDSNSTITSTFENYYETINGVDHHVTGTQVIKNLGHNAAGHPHFSVDVQNASISYTEGTINWTSQRQNEWISGYDTYMNPWDDEYLVSGVSNGTDINGAAFSVQIQNASPLDCKYCQNLYSWIIASGKLDIINAGYPNITVDYGNGSCDYIVYVIINGVTYTFVLA
ncbi:MAG: hypothetical protein WCH34_11860 [Bacteroidota bacterium]